jgi:hypothetical protein
MVCATHKPYCLSLNFKSNSLQFFPAS